MVQEVVKSDRTLFMCEACDMYYEDKDIAEKCEDFCNTYKSCNTELIKYAITVDDAH